MTTAIANRMSVVMSAVGALWLTTPDIHQALYEGGFSWASCTVRDTLHHLASEGRIERRRIGSVLSWRTPPPPPVDLTAHSEAVVAAIKTLAERAGVPLSLLAEDPFTDDTFVVVDSEADLHDLLLADDKLVDRIVKRAAYDMGKALLDVLNGWIEGAQENHEAMQHRNENTGEECWTQFAPEDIRRMVNDAARIMGTREPYVEPDGDAL
jgi:hypothetical protein